MKKGVWHEQKKDKSNGLTALYERLSRDDDNFIDIYAVKHGAWKLFNGYLSRSSS